MRKFIALDTNLLVLLVVGLTNPKYIYMHGRLHPKYSITDFDLLKKFISKSAGVVVTPNVLSETSNLLRQKIREPAETEIATKFRNLIIKTMDPKNDALREIHVRSADAASRTEFFRLGLSDSALLELSKNNIIILSADFPLYLAALEAGYEAINFNHERGL